MNIIIAKIRLMRTIRQSFKTSYGFKKSPMFWLYAELRRQLIVNHGKKIEIYWTNG